jgi:hypothetical protein
MDGTSPWLRKSFVGAAGRLLQVDDDPVAEGAAPRLGARQGGAPPTVEWRRVPQAFALRTALGYVSGR